MGKHGDSSRSRSRSKSSLRSHSNADEAKCVKRKLSSTSNHGVQSKIKKHARRRRSSSSSSCSSAHSKEKSKKIKKLSKKKIKGKKKKKHSSSSDESDGDSSDSSSSPDEREKRRKEKKRRKKEKKLKKKMKREQKRLSKESVTATAVETGPSILLKSAKSKSEQNDGLLSDRAKAMAPMTKEEWDKRQSVVRRVYDEETGRHRLIKGDGEILEEIVSRDRHMAINRQATKGDGDYFQGVATKLKK